ncbi:DUF1127 domain-containing protein [Wenxinia marina]|uniref:Putative conserved small protein n=1 Tax=Wenxinia marina DSM 24838 TaxID=1123501 RepID=A0A0D0Q791_9RHOB|nr:DUF1127 domain-containing protein [Wenxinia marina]KIQ68337.1 putative conserved small protein [Wenxinia marina DSM 24838]GGL72979.1 hypothetical protein GCM10011392_29520 [Wenxinia marina]
MIHHDETDMTALPRTRPFLPGRLALAGAPLQMFAVWRQRRTLGQLDAHRLADLGLTAAEADAEARRPLWDVPARWRA